MRKGVLFGIVLLMSVSFVSAYSFNDLVDDVISSIKGRFTGHAVSEEKSVMVNENNRASLSCDSGQVIKSVEALYWCPDGTGRSALCPTSGAIGESSYYFDFRSSNCGGDPCRYVSKRGNLTIGCGDSVACSDYLDESECVSDSLCEWAQGPSVGMLCQDKTEAAAPAAKVAGAVYLLGKVTYDGVAPVAGATVKLSASVQVLTDGEGEFSIDISSFYDGRDYYTVLISDLFGTNITTSLIPGVSKAITLTSDEGSTVVEGIVPHAIVEASYENSSGCLTYGNSDFSTCGEGAIQVHNGDLIDFDGSQSSFEGLPIDRSRMNWYYVDEDVEELKKIIDSGEFWKLEMPGFLDRFKLKKRGVDVNIDNANIQLRRDSIRIKFSLPIGLISDLGERQYVILEVSDFDGDYYDYYVQEISVGCYDTLRECETAGEVLAGITGGGDAGVSSGGSVVSETLSESEVVELTFGSCDSNDDCSGGWKCNELEGKCAPRDYSQLSCKLSSGRGATVRYEGRSYTNPFYGNVLFKQVASSSPLTVSECVKGDSSKIRVPVCSEKGVEFEVKTCLEDSGCVETDNGAFCRGCINDYSLVEKDDCWNSSGLCQEGGCVQFEEMGFSQLELGSINHLLGDSGEDTRIAGVAGIGYSLMSRDVYVSTKKVIVKILVKALEDDDNSFVRGNIISIIGDVALVPDVDPSTKKLIVDSFSKLLETDQDEYVRMDLASYLRQIDSPKAVAAVSVYTEGLIEKLRENPYQYSLIRELGKGGSKDAVPFLLELMETETDDYLREVASNAVWRISSSVLTEDELLSYGMIENPQAFEIESRAKDIYNEGLPSGDYYQQKIYYKELTGANPIGLIGDLSNPFIVDHILSASEATGISSGLIFAAAGQEGLTEYLSDHSYSRGNRLDIGASIGFDSLYTDLPEIHKYGLLTHLTQENVPGKTATGWYEGAHKFILDIEDVMDASAGMLKLREERLESDMRTYGVELNEFEKEWYIYLYFNLGSGYMDSNGKKGGQWHLRHSGRSAFRTQAHKDLDKQFKETGASNIYFNAGRVAGGSALLKDLGIFESDPFSTNLDLILGEGSGSTSSLDGEVQQTFDFGGATAQISPSGEGAVSDVSSGVDRYLLKVNALYDKHGWRRPLEAIAEGKLDTRDYNANRIVAELLVKKQEEQKVVIEGATGLTRIDYIGLALEEFEARIEEGSSSFGEFSYATLVSSSTISHENVRDFFYVLSAMDAGRKLSLNEMISVNKLYGESDRYAGTIFDETSGITSQVYYRELTYDTEEYLLKRIGSDVFVTKPVPRTTYTVGDKVPRAGREGNTANSLNQRTKTLIKEFCCEDFVYDEEIDLDNFIEASGTYAQGKVLSVAQLRILRDQLWEGR